MRLVHRLSYKVLDKLFFISQSNPYQKPLYKQLNNYYEEFSHIVKYIYIL
jgi:hypothetical protein